MLSDPFCMLYLYFHITYACMGMVIHESIRKNYESIRKDRETIRKYPDIIKTIRVHRLHTLGLYIHSHKPSICYSIPFVCCIYLFRRHLHVWVLTLRFFRMLVEFFRMLGEFFRMLSGYFRMLFPYAL